MSNLQFVEYAAKREIERELESKAKNKNKSKKKSVDDKISKFDTN